MPNTQNPVQTLSRTAKSGCSDPMETPAAVAMWQFLTECDPHRDWTLCRRTEGAYVYDAELHSLTMGAM